MYQFLLFSAILSNNLTVVFSTTTMMAKNYFCKMVDQQKCVLSYFELRPIPQDFTIANCRLIKSKLSKLNKLSKLLRCATSITIGEITSGVTI